MDLDAFMTDEELCRKRQEEADHALAMQLMREINAGADRTHQQQQQQAHPAPPSDNHSSHLPLANPSSTRASHQVHETLHRGWRWVWHDGGRPEHEFSEEEVKAIKARGEAILRDCGEKLKQPRAKMGVIRKETLEQLTQLAIETKFVSGKWLLYFGDDMIDEAWRRVALATSKGQLGNCSKCALTPSGPMYVICVYSPDFRDRQEVKRVLNGLRKIGVAAGGTPGDDQQQQQQQQKGGGGGEGFRGNKRVHYKLDLLTILDVYSGITGTWADLRLSPVTQYSSKDFTDEE